MDDKLFHHLASLGTNSERARALHGATLEAEEELVGALLLGAGGLPLALVSGTREAQSENGSFPAALLLWALWTGGTENLITWHTRLPGFDDPPDEDLDFARHLVDLGGLAGFRVVDHWIFGPSEKRTALRSWMGWEWPSASLDRLIEERRDREMSESHWNPVSGERWSGLGRFHPPWITRLDSLGLSPDALESPFGEEEFRPFGVSGVNLLQRSGVREQTLSYHPPPGWTPLVLEPDELLGLEGYDLVAGLLDHLDALVDGSIWGAVFLDERGRIRRPTAGVFAPRNLVAGRPGTLFAGSLKLGFQGLVTFSVDGHAEEPREVDFALADRLRMIGEVLGFPVEDHLFIESRDRYYSWRDTSRWPWTEIKGLGRGAWPSYLLD